MAKTIAIGADHAGYKLKEELKRYLDRIGVAYIDLGAYGYDKTDDYPDFARKVSKYTAKNNTKGILVCGTGFGMCIAANKVRGIRAVSVDTVRDAKLSRRHNDSNVLCLYGWGAERLLIKKIVKAWLNEKFEGGRHRRRINKIKKMEH